MRSRFLPDDADKRACVTNRANLRAVRCRCCSKRIEKGRGRLVMLDGFAFGYVDACTSLPSCRDFVRQREERGRGE